MLIYLYLLFCGVPAIVSWEFCSGVKGKLRIYKVYLWLINFVEDLGWILIWRFISIYRKSCGISFVVLGHKKLRLFRFFNQQINFIYRIKLTSDTFYIEKLSKIQNCTFDKVICRWKNRLLVMYLINLNYAINGTLSDINMVKKRKYNDVLENIE